MKSQLTFGLERRFVSADDPKKEEKINSVTNNSLPCRLFQKGVRVAFQGERGAYSEEAAFLFFGPQIQLYPVKVYQRSLRRWKWGQ